jgi:hypothetical protein
MQQKQEQRDLMEQQKHNVSASSPCCLDEIQQQADVSRLTMGGSEKFPGRGPSTKKPFQTVSCQLALAPTLMLQALAG